MLSKAHFPKTCLEGTDSQPTNPSMSLSPERRARLQRLSVGLLHGCTSQGPGVMAVGTAPQDHPGSQPQLWRHQQGSMRTTGIVQQKTQECPHPNKRMSQLSHQASCARPPGHPGDGAPSQPMPWAREEGREAGGPARHHTASTRGKQASWIPGGRLL